MVVLAVMLVAVPGPAVSTITHAPTTAPLPTEREPSARAPPRTQGPRALDPAEGPVSCPTSPKSLVPELQAHGRIHDRMLGPYDRPE